MTTPSAAAGAYSALARLSDPSAGLGKAVGETSTGPSFGSLLKNVIGGAMEAGRASDTQTQALATGKANIVDVVTAVSESEVAIEAMVAMRDRVINAYQEIMRMPI
jgi:flagellar hook-basal body complex protein FliE